MKYLLISVNVIGKLRIINLSSNVLVLCIIKHIWKKVDRKRNSHICGKGGGNSSNWFL